MEEEPSGPVRVFAAPVRLASFTESVRGLGICEPLPNLLSTVSSVVDGAVVEVLVAEGEEVKAGQPLVRLDDRLAAQELAERKAARAELEASLLLLRAPPREPDRRAAEVEVERARLGLDLARAVLARLEPLNQRKEVSDQQLFEAKQKLEDATLAQKAAQARLDLLLAGARPEAIAEMEAKVARAESAVAAATARLAYFTLTSPRPGVVEAIHCHPGQVLAPGGVAVEVIDTSSLYLMLSVPVREAARLKPGQPASVNAGEVPAGGEPGPGPLEGTVASVGLQTSAATGAVPARVLVQNAGKTLRAGMAAEVEITVGRREGVLAVPEAALLASEEEPTIAVVRGGKTVHLHPRLGLRQGGLRQVAAEGLAAGEPVITRGPHDLPDGASVEVQEEHPEKPGGQEGEGESSRASGVEKNGQAENAAGPKA